ncbi:MAG: ArsI/CadI family heavy metal resistance metalloenzyme [Stellaceae bacterium]
MKRLHVSVAVDDLDRSVKFYSTLFAAEPTVVKPDYAKWMLADPRVNFSISARGQTRVGLDHLGIQVEDTAELVEVQGRLKCAEGPVLDEGLTTCCYAKSEKSWIADPSGIAWEAFLTRGESTVYGHSAELAELRTEAKDKAMAAGCCGPATSTTPAAPAKTEAACCG